MKSSTAAKNREASKESGKMHQEVEKIKTSCLCVFCVLLSQQGVICYGVFLAACWL